MSIDSFSTPPEKVILIYQNGAPIFAQGEEIGTRMILNFGLSFCSDGYCYPDVHFYLRIIADGGSNDHVEMEARLHNRAFWSDFMDQKPRVLELVDELNNAIRDRQDFDFTEYVNYWQGLDEHFSIHPSSVPKK